MLVYCRLEYVAICKLFEFLSGFVLVNNSQLSHKKNVDYCKIGISNREENFCRGKIEILQSIEARNRRKESNNMCRSPGAEFQQIIVDDLISHLMLFSLWPNCMIILFLLIVYMQEAIK